MLFLNIENLQIFSLLNTLLKINIMENNMRKK